MVKPNLNKDKSKNLVLMNLWKSAMVKLRRLPHRLVMHKCVGYDEDDKQAKGTSGDAIENDGIEIIEPLVKISSSEKVENDQTTGKRK